MPRINFQKATDDELCSICAAGSRKARLKALAMLVGRHKPAADDFACWAWGDRDPGEVVNEAWMIMIRRVRDGHQPGGEFCRDLLRIVRNVASMMRKQVVRKRDRETSMDSEAGVRADQLPSKESSPGHEVARRELFEFLAEWLRKTRLQNRELFVLRTFNRLTYRRIATVLGLSYVQVKFRLSVARKECMDFLLERYKNPEAVFELFEELRW